MALPDPRRDSGGSAPPPPRLVRGPVVVLPPARPGGPERRYAVRPKSVLLLLLSCFGLGGASAAALFAGFWVLSDQAAVRADYSRLRDEVADLQSQVDDLREAAAVAAGTPPGLAPGAASGGSSSAAADAEVDAAAAAPRLALALPAPGTAEPRVRVALLRSAEPLILEGEGLLVHAGDRPVPIAEGRATLRPAASGVVVEGLGLQVPGTIVENRLGTLRAAGRELPSPLEIHSDGGRILLIAELSLEGYLQGVVGAEIPANWPLESKKALAVAARSYALMQRSVAETPWHVEATVDDQVWNGSTVDATSRAAVTATHGEVLTKDGWLVSAFYHACCAGRTESPDSVWPRRPSHGVQPVACRWCEGSPLFDWNAEISSADLLAAAAREGHVASRIQGLRIKSRSPSGRITRIELLTDLGVLGWDGNRFRELLGWNRIRSANFEHRVSGDGFVLAGKGAGHGVGLCQWGARGLAQDGKDYREILATYYAGSKIDKIW
jgi:stage II sporulation protein D